MSTRKKQADKGFAQIFCEVVSEYRSSLKFNMYNFFSVKTINSFNKHVLKTLKPNFYRFAFAAANSLFPRMFLVSPHQNLTVNFYDFITSAGYPYGMLEDGYNSWSITLSSNSTAKSLELVINDMRVYPEVYVQVYDGPDKTFPALIKYNIASTILVLQRVYFCIKNFLEAKSAYKLCGYSTVFTMHRLISQ